MTLMTAAAGVLAIVVQLGVPVQDGSRGGARVSDPLGAPTGAAGAELWADGPSRDGPGAAAGARAREALAGSPFDGRLRAADYTWIEETLARLTLREKVSQLVVAWVEGGRPRAGSPEAKRVRRLVETERVGGFIVGVGPSYGTASWLNEMQGLSRVPLLVTADLEWGAGTRLEGATVLPINMALAAAGGADYAYEAGRITAVEARAAGIHMAFAPVADVNVNPENPVINTRSYGSDPTGVSERVVQFIRGARSGGLMTVVKHFPGHGDTERDSHLTMPVLAVDRFRLDEVELAPFRAAIETGVDGVMTAHLSVPALESGGRARPATLSPPILTDLLRTDLSFTGLVVTDALHMDGVKSPGRNGAVAVEALQAGADILLIPPAEATAIDAVVAAVEKGTIAEARIELSVRRVLAAKALAGLRDGRLVSLGELRGRVGRGEHAAWSRSAAERSLTLVRGRAGSLPIRLEGRAVLAVLYDDRRNHSSGETFEAALARRGARVATARVSKSSGAETLERARAMAALADVVVFASFSRALPWKGALGLPPEVAALAEELAAGGAPVISFGDPYLLRQLPTVDTYLLAWSNVDAMQEAVAAALAGEIPIAGRLPIDLPPGYPVGHGILVPMLPGVSTVRAKN
ncbi:MAG TPA: glycoside hydrolase family 3 N-terminal domain-containing protein [Longimicrobiales bacterium]|nr:glycoside hydrolase family 3 N-terminal domain-containing protein [Longimicrobiales bacterium]